MCAADLSQLHLLALEQAFQQYWWLWNSGCWAGIDRACKTLLESVIPFADPVHLPLCSGVLVCLPWCTLRYQTSLFPLAFSAMILSSLSRPKQTHNESQLLLVMDIIQNLRSSVIYSESVTETIALSVPLKNHQKWLPCFVYSNLKVLDQLLSLRLLLQSSNFYLTEKWRNSWGHVLS